jgi:tetratricopeptide (TPR) repeat protein
LDYYSTCWYISDPIPDWRDEKKGITMTEKERFDAENPIHDELDGQGVPSYERMSFEELFNNGTELLHQGRAADAVPYLERAQMKKPEDVDTGINLAGAYILSKKFKNAVAVLEPLSEANPDHPMVWINLGAAYLGNPVLARDEEQMQAISAFEHALDLNPIAPSVAYNIGLIYRDRREYEMAIDWFRKAVQHNPSDQHARNILAKLEAGQESEG